MLDERTREVFRSRRGSEDREELEAYAADAFVGLLLEHEVRVSSETSTTTHRVTNASHPTGSTNTSAQDPIGMTENADASTMPDAERQDPALRSQDRENRKRRRTKVNVHIVIDHAVLVRGSALPGERCEIPGVGPVSTDWVREILADAFVTAIISRGG